MFFDTLLDENAASHIALGSAYSMAVTDEAEKQRINESKIHIDFMIGSPELDVDGITDSRRARAGAAARRLATVISRRFGIR